MLTDLGKKLITPLSGAYHIPLVSPRWLSYPASFGDSPVRMSNHQFDVFSGWLGHEHVPQNDHGDPGAFPWGRLMALMKEAPRKEQEPDMVVVNYPGSAGEVRYLIAGSRFVKIPDLATQSILLKITGQSLAEIPNINGATLNLLRDVSSDPTAAQVQSLEIDVPTLAAEIAAQLPSGTGISIADLERILNNTRLTTPIG